jgi:hypothetical protein
MRQRTDSNVKHLFPAIRAFSAGIEKRRRDDMRAHALVLHGIDSNDFASSCLHAARQQRQPYIIVERRTVGDGRDAAKAMTFDGVTRTEQDGTTTQALVPLKASKADETFAGGFGKCLAMAQHAASKTSALPGHTGETKIIRRRSAVDLRPATCYWFTGMQRMGL